MENLHIVYEADATRYEINVSYIDNKRSDYDTQYLVSLVNFGECFFESDLNHIAQAIYNTSGRFSSTDAKNIQNAIAERVGRVKFIEFDYDLKKFNFV